MAGAGNYGEQPRHARRNGVCEPHTFNVNQRPGLLLMDGSVYLAFGSQCDYGHYVGWVAGMNTSTRAISVWSDEIPAEKPTRASPSSDLERGQPLHPLVPNGDGRHLRVRRTAARPAHQPFDALRFALEHRFDPAVRQVAHPAGDTLLTGDSAARVTEEDALHKAGDQDPLANHGLTLGPPSGS
jgi:hypothetical protein